MPYLFRRLSEQESCVAQTVLRPTRQCCTHAWGEIGRPVACYSGENATAGHRVGR